MELILTIKCLCVDHLRIYTVERTINATKNWVQKLIVQGANGSEIMETTPVIVLTPVLLFRDHVDRVYQVVEYYSADSSVKTLFVNYLQDTGCMEFEVQTVLSSLGQERSLTGGLAYALQVIRNVKFDWDKCSVKVLEDHLQEKNLGLEILDDNPVLFSVFKTKIV